MIFMTFLPTVNSSVEHPLKSDEEDDNNNDDDAFLKSVPEQSPLIQSRCRKRRWSLHRYSHDDNNLANTLERRLSFSAVKHRKQCKQELTTPVKNEEWSSELPCSLFARRSILSRLWRKDEGELYPLLRSMEISSWKDVEKLTNIIKEKIVKAELSATELAEIVQNIYSTIDIRLRLMSLVNEITVEKARNTMMEFEERFMQNLHEDVFERILREEAANDQKLSDRIEDLFWISTDHLAANINESDKEVSDLLDKAMLDLATINFRESPIEKMECIMNCSRRIFETLRLKPDASESADDFFPILVYVVLQSNPAHLHSQIRYILQFGNAERVMKYEEGYYFTHLCSVVNFLENMTPRSLDLTDEEFENLSSPEYEEEFSKRRVSCSREMSKCICKIYHQAAEALALKQQQKHLKFKPRTYSFQETVTQECEEEDHDADVGKNRQPVYDNDLRTQSELEQQFSDFEIISV